MKNGLHHLFRKSYIIYNMIRNYSLYPKSYEYPVYNLEKIKQQDESKENLAKAYVNFRAAKSSETSSVFYDPLLRIQLEKYYKAEETQKKDIILNPVIILYRAVENCKPLLQLIPVKKSGTTYQVPAEISESRSKFLAVKWLIQSGKDKDRKIRFYDKLALELLSASQNEGSAVKKKQELHRQCEANRAFAHYRWN